VLVAILALHTASKAASHYEQLCCIESWLAGWYLLLAVNIQFRLVLEKHKCTMLKYVTQTVTNAQIVTWGIKLRETCIRLLYAEARPCSNLTMQARHEKQLQDQFRGCEVVPECPSIISMHASLNPVTIV